MISKLLKSSLSLLFIGFLVYVYFTSECPYEELSQNHQTLFFHPEKGLTQTQAVLLKGKLDRIWEEQKVAWFLFVDSESMFNKNCKAIESVLKYKNGDQFWVIASQSPSRWILKDARLKTFARGKHARYELISKDIQTFFSLESAVESLDQILEDKILNGRRHKKVRADIDHAIPLFLVVTISMGIIIVVSYRVFGRCRSQDKEAGE